MQYRSRSAHLVSHSHLRIGVAPILLAFFLALGPGIAPALAEEPVAPPSPSLLGPAVSPARPEPRVGPWELTSDPSAPDGIVVHRRRVEGSPLHEFRGRAIVEMPLARVLAVIRDSPRRVDWMTRCASAWTIDDPDPRVQISYNRTRAPWPVSDRDVVLRAETSVDFPTRRVIIAFHSIDAPDVKPFEGAVRMPFLRGHWILVPEHGGDWTRVEYQVHADPGGALPDWVANIISKTVPYKTIVALRQQVVRMSYPVFETFVSLLPEYKRLMAETPPAPSPPTTTGATGAARLMPSEP